MVVSTRAKKIFSFVFGCLIGLVLAEAETRIVLPTVHPPTGLLRPVPNDPIAFEYIPNVEIGNVKINDLGFRDDPFPLRKDATEIRILWIGDSIVMGWGIKKEERFTDILDAKLKKQNPCIRTINMAVESYSNYQELLVLQRKGITINPDVVILGFCWNDILKYEHFVDSTGMNRFILQKDSTNNKGVSAALGQLSQSILRQSRFLNLIRNAILDLIHEIYPNSNKAKRSLTFSEYVDWYLSAWKSSQVDSLYSQILTMNKLLTNNNVKFNIVMFPLSIQVDHTSLYDNYLDKIQATQNKFRQFCELHDIHIYDLTPDLIRITRKDKRNVFMDVWHYTKAGNEIIADLIYHDLNNTKSF